MHNSNYKNLNLNETRKITKKRHEKNNYNFYAKKNLRKRATKNKISF